MKVRDVIRAVEAFAPFDAQKPGDNTGLQIGSPDQEVHGILLGFDCTPELVDEAVRRGCDMIINHHPLLYHPVRSVGPDDPTGAAIWRAVRAGVAVYAAHTSADRVIAGVSGAMARRLGLQHVRILAPEGVRSDVPGESIGFGVVGDLPQALSAREAIELVKECFGLRVMRTSRPVDIPVRTLAMCGGSGSSLIDAARAAGAQLYLCGDISYHYFFTPADFMLADIGHFESEVEIVEVFLTVLRKNFPNFAIHISDNIKNSNPVYYF